MQQITGKYRYTVLGLVFLAVTINYIDRQIIGLLKPILEKEFQWTEKDYADIVFLVPGYVCHWLFACRQVY